MAGEALDANAAQRRYWNTVAGPRWAAEPGLRERRNQESLALLLARLDLAGGESVVEIGCGTGALTLPLAAAVGERGRVVAVDISEPMLTATRQRVGERGLRNVTLLLGDAQVFAFEPGGFDLATSRMGVMFFADPAAAFRNIGGALKPGGRLVFACWGPLAENRHWLIAHDVAVRHLGPRRRGRRTSRARSLLPTPTISAAFSPRPGSPRSRSIAPTRRSSAAAPTKKRARRWRWDRQRA